MEGLWEGGVSELAGAARSVLGVRRRRRARWVGAETLRLADERAVARVAGRDVRALNAAVRRSARADRENWWA